MGLLKRTVEKFAQDQRDFFESSLTDEDKAEAGFSAGGYGCHGAGKRRLPGG